MKYLSLFSGIGGFELGIKQAYEELQDGEGLRGLRQEESLSERPMPDSSSQSDKRQYPTCIGFSEIDKYATQVYNKQFNHKNYGDITKINEKELPDFDLLVGGFPCQSFSIAGLRKGFEDTRGTLFFEIARIIREKQPRLLLLENVKGLLSHDKGSTFHTIISTLDELGYDCQWQVLNSKNFGVPQNRERVFIVGHLRGTSRPEVFPIGGATKQANKNVFIGIDNYRREGKLREYKGVCPTLNTNNGGQRTPCTIVKPVLTPDRPNKRQNGRRFKENGEPSFTLTAQDKHGVMIKEATKKGYAEANEGDSINLSVPNSKTRRGRVGKGIAQTIDTGMQQHTLQDAKIRRLTPTECERLQGFPDGWTAKGINEKGEEVDISDSQRYKMCGNAVTVNVIKEIMLKLIK